MDRVLAALERMIAYQMRDSSRKAGAVKPNRQMRRMRRSGVSGRRCTFGPNSWVKSAA